jgi:heat shock protein HslJ
VQCLERHVRAGRRRGHARAGGRHACRLSGARGHRRVRLLADLAQVATWSIDGSADDQVERLTLFEASGEPILVFVPLPASPVLGSWQVTAYRDADGAIVPSIADAQPTATFATDGRVAGSTGCNTYSADYVVEGQALAVGPIATTLVACDETLAAQEQAFLAALGASAGAALLSDTTLLLTDAVGAATLILESSEPPPGPTPSPSPSPSATPTAAPTPTPTPTPAPARVRVPDVRGQTEANAITALNDVDLLVGDRYRRYRDDLAAGRVIRTDPPADTRVAVGSRIDLYVSRGPQPTPTPTPTAKPTPRPTAKPTPRPTAKPTPRPTAKPTPRPTPRPTPKPTPRPTAKPTPRPTPDPGTRLDGSAWVLLDFRDSSGSNVGQPGSDRATADFADGRIAGFAGCNTYSGSYTTNGSRIDITGFATTGISCDGDAMAFESAYLDSLGTVDRFAFRDNETHGELLVLLGPDDQTRLRYTPAGG